MWIVDNYHAIGKSHVYCQDYTISGVFPIPYLIVADGCSSADNSDVGARFLALSAKTQLLNQLTCHSIPTIDKTFIEEDYSFSCLTQALTALNILDFDVKCLFSTLIVSFVLNDKIHTIFFGDGTYFEVNMDGNITFTTLTYEGNAPYYLYYHNSSISKNDYLTKGYGRLFVDGIDNGVKNYHHIVSDATKVSKFGISTDGISSFVEIDANGAKKTIADSEIIPNISDIKNKSSEFLKARILKMMSRYNKKGIYHDDDLGVAVAIKEI